MRLTHHSALLTSRFSPLAQTMLSMQFELGTRERRLGFRGIRRMQGEGGRERFGALELAGGGLAAVLELRGRNLWLESPEELAEVGRRLAGALPAYPVQFLLSRRKADLGRLAGRWRE